jgi:hypothetical protein
VSGRALTIDITTRDQQTLAALKRIQRELGQLDKSIDTTAQNSDKLSKSAEEYAEKLSAARQVAGGIVLGGTVATLGAATKAASSLAEAQGKASEVFAESYDEVKRFAEGAAQSLGQSERQVLDAAGTYGNLLQAMGLTTEQSKEMSIELVKLATDLAKFNDVPVDQALTALRSGLSGETEPLKQFGINLNDARLKQEAMTLGLYDGKGALDANAKAQAAYSLIMQDSTLAQGTFAREASTAAGQHSIAAAELENGAASMGTALLPVYAKAAGLVGDLASAFQLLPGPAQTAVVGVGGLTLAAGLLGPRIAEGARMMQVGGARAAEFGRNLIVPKQAVEGLGTSSQAAQGRLAGLRSSITGLSAGSVLGATAVVGLGAVIYGLQQNAANARRRAAELEAAIMSLADTSRQTGRSVEDVFVSDSLPRWFAEHAELVDRFNLKSDEMWEALQQGEGAWRDYIEAQVGGSNSDHALALLGTLDMLGKQFYGGQDAASAYTGAQEDLSSATEDTTKSTEDMEAAQRSAAAAMEESRAAAERARSAADAYRQAEDQVSSAQEGVASARARVVDAERAVADARRGVEQASKGVADAERGLADARAGAEEAARDLADAEREQREGSEALRDAQEQVADAERDLAQAQRDSLTAQEELNQARETATERLERMRAALADDFEIRQAQLALDQARARQAELDQPGRDGEAREVSALDRRSAALSVESAERRLKAVLEDRAEAERELAEEEEKGVEGSAEVVAAKEAVEEAAENETAAEERLVEAHGAVAEAQEQMAARVVEAQARVQEANDRVRDAADRVRDAVDGVRDAQQRVVEQREAVVEARRAVAEAEDQVTEALVNQAIAQEELNTALGNSQGALDEQIVKLLELAGQMEPGSPVRQRLMEMAEELNALTARPWTIHLRTSLVAADAVAGVGDSALDLLERATGGRAIGGAVGAGRKVVVGEKRPEILEFGPTTTGTVRTPEQEAVEQRQAAAFAERESRRAGRFGADRGAVSARDVSLTFQITEAHSAQATADATAAKVLEVLDLEVAH